VVERLPGLVQEHLRATDLPVHAGGDEVVVVLPETGASGASVVAERVSKELLNSKLALRGRPLAVRVTAGVAEHRAGMSAEALVLEARDAARAAKQARRAARAAIPE
jgi:diguanylate cyclase (GGDEF)-like protein